MAGECEELKKMPEEKFKEIWKGLPLPQWIYSAWKWSFIGSLCTLLGTIITAFGL